MDRDDAAAKRKVLKAHRRRQAKLAEQRALLGYSRDPKIDMELEDIAEEITQLQAEVPDAPSAQTARHHGIMSPKSWLYIGICTVAPVNLCMALFGPIAGSLIGLLIGVIVGMLYAVVFPSA